MTSPLFLPPAQPETVTQDTAENYLFEEQFLRDLEVLDRIDRQHECFFDAMGELAARRSLR